MGAAADAAVCVLAAFLPPPDLTLAVEGPAAVCSEVPENGAIVA